MKVAATKCSNERPRIGAYRATKRVIAGCLNSGVQIRKEPINKGKSVGLKRWIVSRLNGL